MKRYIKVTYTICFLLITVTVLFASFLMFYNTKLSSIKESLKMTLETIKVNEIPTNIELTNYTQTLANINENLRVTIIDLNGNVLGDSEVGNLNIGNHLNRPEVSNAIKTGFGEHIRKSEVTGIKTVYAAAKISGDVILRLSYPFIIVYDFLQIMIPIIILLFILMLLFINKFSDNFSKKLLSPLESINKLLETKEQADKDKNAPIKTFKEVEPILNNIDYLVRKLNYDFIEMEKTQQMRTDFVANVSHELKSPLTSIKGFAELVSSGLITNKDKQDDYLKRIVTESDRLLNIINNILYLSEAESIKIDHLELEVVSLDKVAANVIKSLEGLRAQKKIMLFVTGEGSIRAVEKDIWEIIYNLVDNGIRYGKQRGFVQVKIESTTTKTTLIVQDDGIGIDKEHLPRIFERFYREDISRSRKGGGTGLGLSIVRNIAVKYGGVVTVDSMKGNGTSFKIEFFHI